MFGRRKVAAVVGEFLGTATLVFVILNISRSQLGLPYFVALAAGLAVMLVGASIASDVHLNPALTAGLWTARRVKTIQAIAYIAAQMLGAWAAYGLYKYFMHGTVQHTNVTFDSRLLVAEATGAFVFSMAAASVLYERVWGTRRAVTVGGAYVLGILVASAASNGFINPAVALGTVSWGWAYTLGPVLGAVIGVNLYALFFSSGGEAKAAAVRAAASASAPKVEVKTAAKPAASAKKKTAKK